MADRLDVYPDAAGGFRWRRVAGNNRVLCSGESHTREADAWRAAHRSCPDLDPDWAPPAMELPDVDHALADATAAFIAALGGDPDELAAARDRLTELTG